MSDDDAVLGLEPDDLDGHSIDELTDYLEHDRMPPDPSIDGSPACRIALSALQRLHETAVTLLDPDLTADTGGADQDWIGAVLAALPVDARAGRRFPWPSADPSVSAHVTEGAIRGLVRAIGDDVPGLLVGAVRIAEGDPAPLAIDVALAYGTVLASAVEAFRGALRRALPDHLPFTVGPVDIHVVALVHVPSPGTAPVPGTASARR